MHIIEKGPLKLELAWTGPEAGVIDDVTLGDLRLTVAGKVLWGQPEQMVEWSWIDLLSNMSDAVDCGGLQDVPRPPESEDDDRAFDWDTFHDMSRWVASIHMPDLKIHARAADVQLRDEHGVETVMPLDQFCDFLLETGDLIAARVTAGCPGHWSLEGWQAARAKIEARRDGAEKEPVGEAVETEEPAP